MKKDKYSKEYKIIRNKAKSWPTWKIDHYNNYYAISKNAIKLPNI